MTYTSLDTSLLVPGFAVHHEYHSNHHEGMEILQIDLLLDLANLCCTCYYHLSELRRVHWYLNQETAVKVEGGKFLCVKLCVSSLLDYCNSLRYHIKRHMLGDYKELKMPCVTPCAN